VSDDVSGSPGIVPRDQADRDHRQQRLGRVATDRHQENQRGCAGREPEEQEQ